jgi:predicted Zn-dependent peptidase
MLRTGDTKQTVLANGMRVVEMPIAGRSATTIVIAYAAGARHEQPEEVGVAHLLEHMAFKGAEKYRSSRDFNRTAEYLGTELHGQTTEDFTEFSAVVRAESAMATIDLLSDLSGRALLDESHLDTERAVILQELADANEDPAARADQRISRALFADHRLGTDIAGEPEQVRRLTHDVLLDFHQRQWSSECSLLVITGNLTHVDRYTLEEYLLRIPTRPAPSAPTPIGPFARRIEVEEHDSDVVHLRLAYSVPELDLSEPRNRAVAHVYSDLLGGPMGSRLYEELREQRGLCYGIDGYLWGHEGKSFLSVDCSIDASNLSEACERIETIIDELRKDGPTREEMRRAGSYAGGSCAVHFESAGAHANHAVVSILEFGDCEVDPTVYLAMLESVTYEDVAGLAALVKQGPCVGCVGPVSASDFQ